MSLSIIIKVIKITKRDKFSTEFTAFWIQKSQGINMIINKDLEIRECDIIHCTCNIENGKYVIDLNDTPIIEPSHDEKSIIQCFSKVIKRGNVICRKIYNNIKQLCKNGETVDSKMSFLSDSWKKDSDEYILQYFTNSINENEAKMLLQWWYEERNLRKLYLLGLNDNEINEAKLTCHEIYKICSVNPYVIPSIPLEKCKNIMNTFGLFPSNSNIMCGTIIRYMWTHINKTRATCIKREIVEANFPEYNKFINDLIKYYGVIQHSDGNLQLNCIYKIEKNVSEFIINLMNENWIKEDTPLDVYENNKIRHSANYTKNLNEEQKLAVQGALDHTICIITAGSGCGKCLGKGTEILMYNGSIKKVEDIKINDKIMGPDSKPRNVLSTCKGIDKMYKIIPEKGDSFICNEPHVLTLKYKNEIIDLPLEDYIQLKNKEDYYLIQQGIEYYENNRNLDCELYINNINVNDNIDPLFLITSKKNRLILLYGIMNKYGLKSLNIVRIKTLGKIDNDIIFLARSLGFLAYKNNNIIYIENKINSEIKFKYEYINIGEYYGFELDSDGRFLLSNFIVTHNTTCIDQIAYNLDLKGEKYSICSFTGKAVSRVKEVTKKENCLTIDRLITCANKIKGSTTINHIIIDECSMVTTELFYRLIISFPEIKRLTLVGDINQLPPINHGCFFNELIKSGRIPIYYLNISHRFYFTNNDNKQIDGIMENAKALLNHNIGQFNFITSDNDRFIQNFQVFQGNYEKVGDIIKKFKKLGIESEDIVILSPYEAELNNLNTLFQQIYTNNSEYAIDYKGRRFNIGDRVMHKINDYDLNIFNGTEGIVKKITDKSIKIHFQGSGTIDFLLNDIKNDDPYQLLPTIKKKLHYNKIYDRIDNGFLTEQEKDALRSTERLDISFAITVDKSQGSEYNYVIFYVPFRSTNNYKFVNRNRIYTAITRAKIACYVCAPQENISRGVLYNPYCERIDRLSILLKENLPEFKPINCQDKNLLQDIKDEYGLDPEDFY